jgi:glycosyltransferase involved in cell wall biosynthesis
MRLVFVTQTLDADHPALAQSLDLVDALARHCDELVVLCQSVGRLPELPANIRVREFGSRSRLGRGARFVTGLGAELVRRPRPAAVLAHMVPLYVVLAAPLAKPLGVRLALWYTHWSSSAVLRAATRLADVILSVDRRSFPLSSSKLRGIGHAIDVDTFTPQGTRPGDARLRLLALGRTARWKGYDTMLAALEQAISGGVDAALEIRGPQLTDDERAHLRELEAKVASSPELRERVRLTPPSPRAELPALLAGVDALVSATQPRGGSATLDKVVYEAAACGLPVLASNPALEEFLAGLPLELRFAPGDAAGLADLIRALADAPAEARDATGAELRERVLAGHSVESWAAAVAAAVRRRGHE